MKVHKINWIDTVSMIVNVGITAAGLYGAMMLSAQLARGVLAALGFKEHPDQGSFWAMSCVVWLLLPVATRRLFNSRHQEKNEI